ncbi:uracil-xanthine permease family protein [Youngiibacter fragilis]|uniref:Uracil permease n=1 Tax=Youngiibacter fragilis 232.1 TaxID=994573 RepID=V7I1N7_9CLOT|nr:nucleobase:cation symporter-2 family protein [Youngiibacter fragilis]ETA79788.1 uracil permease [Youngiibacter fragilis 232.1]
MNTKNTTNTSLFDFFGKPAWGKAVPLGIQHVLAMIVGNVTPSIMVAATTGLTVDERTLLVQTGMFIAGLATFMQIFSFKRIGAKLPVIMGVSFSYIPVLLAIGKEYGIAAIFGAQLIGSLAAVLMGFFIKPIRRYFPPIVAGTVVLTIGLSLYPIGINYMAGGVGQPTYASLTNWAVALVVMATVLICNNFGKGIFKLASILVGIAAGYALSLALGIVNFAPLETAKWVALPQPLHFGIQFVPTAIVSMIVMYVVNSIQAVGDFSSTTVGGMNREVTDDELSGGIVSYGMSSFVAAIIGGLPTATYSQNVGIVASTKVVARRVFIIAASIVIAAGFIPKFGALMTTIPYAVLGGATISVFGMITMTGIKLITQDELSTRNMSIVGLSVALGMGMTQVPASLAMFPAWFLMVFGKSPVVIATLMSLILNIVIPKKSLVQEQKEREDLDSK